MVGGLRRSSPSPPSRSATQSTPVARQILPVICLRIEKGVMLQPPSRQTPRRSQAHARLGASTFGPAKSRRLDEPIAVSPEDLVPNDHFYRQREAMLDLSFVRNWVSELYAERGRLSIDPVVHAASSPLVYANRSRMGRPAPGAERILSAPLNRCRLPGVGLGTDSSGGERHVLRNPREFRSARTSFGPSEVTWITLSKSARIVTEQPVAPHRYCRTRTVAVLQSALADGSNARSRPPAAVAWNA